MTGTIKMLDQKKKFGFVRADDGKEFFFHMSNFDGNFDDLARGQKVEFEVGQGPKGLRAENVVLAG